ncbi:glyoxalase [Nocardioides sp. Root1257]|uniref:VOC family protein n=1 Tax=unclassified Nocardioides TaxID=2615069 RepID=UPI0006F2BE9D|nr:MULTISPECIES: VOC family protein [unclassified Nocardioides]KQW53656.1 glyoxalase [Nocardioides sp. Root1257]KRC56342.1 glyoxalase [Nocardioides sp. Root224]
MITPADAFHGFSVDDTEAARAFYADVLGIEVTDAEMGGIIRLHVGGGAPTIVYPKPDHTPAGFTILNFPVADVEATVDELTARGVVFERYEGTPVETDAKGVFRGGGPLIAWFKDPAGNVLSVIAAD